MLDGIEILSTTEQMEFYPALLVLLCIIGGIVFSVVELIDGGDGVLGLCLGIFGGVLIYFLVFCLFFRTTYTEYKITISDEASMTEFYEKYEILDVEGRIYTVRERETE